MAIHVAATNGHVRYLELFIKNGCDLNAGTDKNEDTALMLACRRGHFRAAEYLVVCGAYVHVKNKVCGVMAHIDC